MNNTVLAALSIFAALTGCASTPELNWTNPKLPTGREGALQEMSDKVLCGDVASGEVPMPSTREFMPVPSGGYTFSGQATTYGSSGVYNTQFNGTARPRNDFNSGFANGYNMGMAIGGAIRRSRWEKSYAECMTKLGWIRGQVSHEYSDNGAAYVQKGGEYSGRPLGSTCRYTGDCQGTSICRDGQCAARTD